MLICTLVLLGCLARPSLGDVCDGERFDPLDVMDGTDGSIFDDLTVRELEKVKEYLFEQDAFDLKEASVAGVDKAFIYVIETLPPSKAEALDYLDNGGPRPGKYVKAILYRANLDPPTIEEYKVGPMSGSMTHTLINEPISWHKRNNAHWNQEAALLEYIEHTLASVEHLILDITGYRFGNCTDNCLIPQAGGAGFHSDPSSQKIWLQFLRDDPQGYTLHPIGLQILVDATDATPSNWNLDRLWWRGKHFLEIAKLKEFLETHLDNITKTAIFENDKDLFSALYTRGTPLTDTPRRGPTCRMPDGRRHEVEGHHINWQGWELDFNIRTITGIQAHNIKFLGDRIAYEVALNEMIIIYSGDSPFSSHTTYFDSNYLLGGETYELIPGLDCPENADYFDFAHFTYGESVVWKKSACLFEFHSGIPLRRHYQSDFEGSYTFAQGMPDNALVLRTIVSVWNYDYIVDLVFHQNGAMEVKWSLSGYLIASYYTGDSGNKYAYEISPNMVGNIHHHAASFKVDLDIQGTSNRFETLDIKGMKVDDETEPGNQIWQQVVETTLKESELDAAYKYNFDTPKYLLFYNNETLNRFGNPRAYRILPNFMAKMVGGDEYFDEWKGASWMRYQLAVTRYKDEEPSSSSMYLNSDPFNADVSLQDYIDDDESIVDEDLVVWVNLGTHHIPHTEDLPITTTMGVQGSFFLLPYNYFQEDPSLSSTDNIRTEPDLENPGEHVYLDESEDLANCPEKVKKIVKPCTGGVLKVAPGHSLLLAFILLMIIRY